jgi:hypothetical protein
MESSSHHGFQRGFLLGAADNTKNGKTSTDKNDKMSNHQVPLPDATAATKKKVKNVSVNVKKSAVGGTGFAKGFLNNNNNNNTTTTTDKEPPPRRKATTTTPKKSGLLAKGFLNKHNDKKKDEVAANPNKETSGARRRDDKSTTTKNQQTKSTTTTTTAPAAAGFGTGFSKGFLNSNTTKKKSAKKKEKTETSSHEFQQNNAQQGAGRNGREIETASAETKTTFVSLDLLGFENIVEETSSNNNNNNNNNNNKTVSLLFANNESEHKALPKAETTGRLISVLSTDKSPESSQHRGSPLISVVVDDDAGSNQVIQTTGPKDDAIELLSSAHDKEEEKEEESLWKEVTTTTVHKDQESEEPLWKEVATTRSSEQPGLISPINHIAQLLPKEQEKSNTSTMVEDLDLSTLQNVSSYVDFQRDMESLAWQSGKSKGVLENAKEWTPTKVQWAWQWILTTDRKLSSNHKRLIAALLGCHPAGIVPFLRNDTQAEKVVALQCVRLLQESLADVKNDPIQDHQTMLDWISITLEALLRLIEQPRRTVLAQSGCNAALCVVANISQGVLLGNNIEKEEFESLLSDLAALLDRVLQLQLAWKRPKSGNKKNRAMIAVTEDWLRITRSYTRGKISSLIWCNQLFGVEFKCFKQWGGLLETFLCNDTPTNLENVGEAISVCCKVQSRNEEDPYELVTRSLFRGILASLSVTKTSCSHLPEFVGSSLSLLSKCRQQDSTKLVWAFL